jgi:Zn-dependent M16 (insulinase) family peptidase
MFCGGVLENEIKEHGGACGTGCHLKNGVLFMYSYRDPHTLSSYQVFEKAAHWVKGGHFSDREFMEAKLRVFKELDKVVEPQAKGFDLIAFGVKDEERETARRRVFDVTRDDVIDVVTRYVLNPMSKNETSQVIFGSQGIEMESLVSRGWKIERGIEGLSVNEESYEQNKKLEPPPPDKLLE